MRAFLLKIIAIPATICLLAGFATASFGAESADALDEASKNTLAKLRAYAVALKVIGFDYASAYDVRYLEGVGGKVFYPAKEVLREDAVLETLEHELSLNWASNKPSALLRKLFKHMGNGTWRTGHRYVMHLDSSVPRPSSFSDFTVAIGGCTLHSIVTFDLVIFTPPSFVVNGIPVFPAGANCRINITSWIFWLTDIYKWGKGDAYAARLGVLGFQPGEVYRAEQLGLVKSFDIESEYIDLSEDPAFSGDFDFFYPGIIF